MLDTSTTLLADLLDKTLVFYELQTTEMKILDAGLEMSEADYKQLDEAFDTFEDALDNLLASKESLVLADALNTLVSKGRIEEARFLESAIHQNIASFTNEQGELFQAFLLPLVAPTEYARENIPPELCQRIGALVNKAFGERFQRVTVSGVLRNPHEIYNLKFHEIFELNTALPNSMRRLLTENLTDTDELLWKPTIRFILVQTVTAPVVEDGSWVVGSGRLGKETMHTLTKDIGTELSVIFGAPLGLGYLSSVNVARMDGMAMYAHNLAKLSIERQLATLPDKPTSMMVTLHTLDDLDEIDPDLAEITQVRIALLGASGELVAGHILEVNDSLPPSTAQDLTELIAKWSGLRSMSKAKTPVEILEKGEEPFFCKGMQWDRLPKSSRRLSQETF